MILILTGFLDILYSGLTGWVSFSSAVHTESESVYKCVKNVTWKLASKESWDNQASVGANLMWMWELSDSSVVIYPCHETPLASAQNKLLQWFLKLQSYWGKTTDESNLF